MRQISTLLLLLFFATSGYAVFSSLTTQKIDVIKNNSSTDIKLDPSGDVILNNLTGGRVLYLNTDKEIKSSSLSQTDLESDLMRLSGDQSASGEKTFTGKLIASTTDNASIPCPVMTEAQRDSIATPELGDCIFNSSSETLNVYDGATWKSAGGGISQWVTGFNYAINDIVVYVGEIYQALTAHTSGTFATDLANGDWVKIADTIQAKGLNQATNTFKTIAAPNNQVTSIGSNQALLETGNTNLLANPSFEHATYDTSWTCSGTGTESKETTVVIDGNASLKVLTSSQTMDCSQVSTLYASQLAGVQGLALVWINSTSSIAQVCAVVDSVDTDCVAISNSGTWLPYAIPFSMGSTNNGIRVKSASDSATTYIDLTYVGTMKLQLDPGTLVNYVFAPNIAKPKTCYYAFGGASATLASPTVCAASPCVEVYDSCSAGTAPSRAGSGVYNDLTFANSTWKANTYIHCNCSVWTTTSGTDRECAQSFVTGDNSISTNSSGGYVANFITTTTNGTNSDTYVSIECTADAP